MNNVADALRVTAEEFAMLAKGLRLEAGRNAARKQLIDIGHGGVTLRVTFRGVQVIGAEGCPTTEPLTDEDAGKEIQYRVMAKALAI